RAAVCFAAGGGELSLVERRSNAGRTRPGGNDSRAANHGVAICGFFGGVESQSTPIAFDCGYAGGVYRHLDNVRSLLSLDFYRSTSHRTTSRKQIAWQRPLGGDGSSRGGDRQSRGVVWNGSFISRRQRIGVVCLGSGSDSFCRYGSM